MSSTSQRRGQLLEGANERGREGGREEGREGVSEGVREGGREGGRERWRGREGERWREGRNEGRCRKADLPRSYGVLTVFVGFVVILLQGWSHTGM